jgi:hypothetical protein
MRTAARRRMRRSFGAISKAWSHWLTEEQRQAWIVAGAKVKSHPRLSQWGWLFGEMHFQAINSARSRIGARMLAWPPERVVFGPNPVEGLALRYIDGRIRLRLKVSGALTEDIMVFGQAPCSAGRKKWRHGAYLGLLPAPLGGECDVTDLYVQRYGEPEPGKKVFIRARQQKDGWMGRDHDLTEVVPAPQREPFPGSKVLLGNEETKTPSWHLELRPRSWSNLLPNGAGLDFPRIPWATPLIPVSCTMHKGVLPDQYRITSQATLMQCRRETGCSSGVRALGRLRRLGMRAETRLKGHRRELWRGS